MPKEYTMRFSLFCTRCEYEWFSNKQNPVVCARCKNPYWNIPKKDKTIIAN